MRIATPSPVRTAVRVRQLAPAFPIECARAIEQQPDALVGVGNALAFLAEEQRAAQIMISVLRRRPELARPARPFYDRLRELAPSAPSAAPYAREIITARERP